MEPTLPDRSFRMVSRLHYHVGEPSRGDIVVIRMAGKRTMFLKRIVGLPGERIRFMNGTLLINDVPYEEPYVVLAGRWSTGEVHLKESEYFVAGDNRGMEAGEHVMGVTRRNRIEGLLLW